MGLFIQKILFLSHHLQIVLGVLFTKYEIFSSQIPYEDGDLVCVDDGRLISPKDMCQCLVEHLKEWCSVCHLSIIIFLIDHSLKTKMLSG